MYLNDVQQLFFYSIENFYIAKYWNVTQKKLIFFQCTIFWTLITNTYDIYQLQLTILENTAAGLQYPLDQKIQSFWVNDAKLEYIIFYNKQ